ncbi:MAG: hypothetical protein B7Z37_25515, partial [Verrucomicrobia bacterium 12-59-8]
MVRLAQGLCEYCRCPERYSSTTFSIEHITPRTKGGSDEASNLAFACQANKLNAADPIHVLVWDERQPRQKEAYENFLGNEIVERLKATTTDLEFRSVALDDAEQGLSAGNLEWADVIIWWGHVRQG